MVASFFQLYHSLAVVAPLPAFLLGHLDQTGSLVVLRTLPSGVILATTTDTYFGTASTASSVFATRGHIHLDLAWLDPLTAPFCRAVEVFRSSILLKLLIPEPLELIIEQTINMFQWNMFLSAASWRHMLRVFDGECELALQACMAHAMTTSKLCRLADKKVIIHTDETIDSLHLSNRWRSRPRPKDREDASRAPTWRLLSSGV
jgi:hypothetical protein